MKPEWAAQYRAATERYKPLNTAQKMCAGPCKRRRSVGQFAPGDTLCLICRKRAKP